MIGLPKPLWAQSTPLHLSVPERAKVFETSRCRADRMLTENAPLARIFGQLLEVRMTLNDTSGGSSETL